MKQSLYNSTRQLTLMCSFLSVVLVGLKDTGRGHSSDSLSRFISLQYNILSDSVPAT